MKKLKYTIWLLCFLFTNNLWSQEQGALVYQTFKDTRVINTQSVEVLKQAQLDLRVGHRFGDIFGSQGGWSTFYGLENAADVFIGLEYGLTNQVTLGLSRTKGGGTLGQLINGLVKYRPIQQRDKGMPISVTLVGTSAISTMNKVNNDQSLASFPKFAHRIFYSLQLHIARKFGQILAFQLSPTFIWRNYVPTDDKNALLGLGLAARIQVTKVFGIILDANIPFSTYRLNGENDYYLPLGLGFEIETGGHVFQINLTNAEGMLTGDYMSNTQKNWLEGEFRLGFTISRIFQF